MLSVNGLDGNVTGVLEWSHILAGSLNSLVDSGDQSFEGAGRKPSPSRCGAIVVLCRVALLSYSFPPLLDDTL